VVRPDSDQPSTTRDQLVPFDDRLPRPRRARFQIYGRRVELARRLSRREESCIKRVQQNPSNHGGVPARAPTRQLAIIIQISRDLGEWSPRQEFAKNLTDVFRFRLVNSVARTRRVSLDAWHPPVPMRWHPGCGVPCESPPHRVAGCSLGLDPNLTLSKQHQLLQHEIVELGVDAFAGNDHANISTWRTDVEHVAETARDPRRLGHDHRVELACVKALEHRRPGGFWASLFGSRSVVVLILGHDPPSAPKHFGTAVFDLLGDPLVLVNGLSRVDGDTWCRLACKLHCPILAEVCLYTSTAAAVAFAGLLVMIMRSDEVRGILTDLVRRALTVQ